MNEAGELNGLLKVRLRRGAFLTLVLRRELRQQHLAREMGIGAAMAGWIWNIETEGMQRSIRPTA